MLKKTTTSIFTSTLFLSIALLSPISNIKAFAPLKKRFKTTKLEQKEIKEAKPLTIEIQENKEESHISESASIQKETPITSEQKPEQTPEPQLNPEEKEALFNKELSELCLEYQQQLAQLEALKNNPEFIKLTTPLQLQRKELENKINQIIGQFIPEMNIFYQQLQNLIKKYQENK